VADVAANLRRQAPGRLAATLFGEDVRAAAGLVGSAELGIVARGLGDFGWRGDIATGADQRPRPLVLGGQTLVQMGNGRAAVLGYGQSATAMLDAASDRPQPGPALLAGASPGNLLVAQPQAGAAYAQRFGDLTFGLAFGTMALADVNAGGRSRRDRAGPSAHQAVLRADHRIGAARLGVAVTWLDEQASLLGSQLPPVFGLRGAVTTSVLADATVPFGHWHIGASGQLGRTRAALSGGGVWQQAGPLASAAASLSLGRSALFDPGDALTVTLAQPLRASGQIRLVTGTDAVRLGPGGRELALEADYRLPIPGGFVRLGGFWRRQPGHIATAPADIGLALRTALRF
jgi:hypothetical protein